jgi:hypothetical protein
MKRSIRGANTRTIADFLGLERNIVVLLGAIIIALTGERLWLGFASKYLETLDAGVFLIGLLLLMSKADSHFLVNYLRWRMKHTIAKQAEI